MLSAGEANERQVPVPIVSGQNSDQRKAYGGALHRGTSRLSLVAFRRVSMQLHLQSAGHKKNVKRFERAKAGPSLAFGFLHSSPHYSTLE